MKTKLTLLWLFLLLSFSSVFGIGVFDDNGKYQYFTNNPSPLISINITSPSQVINVSYANISINENSTYYPLNYLMSAGENKVFNFTLGQSITSIDTVHFVLKAYSSENNRIIPQGDPTDFDINFDNVSPVLLSPDVTKDLVINYQNPSGTLEFNEKISSYLVYLNGELAILRSADFSSLNEYSNKIVASFDSEKLLEGNNELKVIARDMAENNVTYNFNVFYRGKPIEIKLMTRDDDSSLKYYYNVNYLGLFNKTIYSSVEDYSLKLTTSKPANCYYTDSLTAYKLFGEVPIVNTKVFSSQNGLVHTLDVSAKSYSNGDLKRAWVSCINKNIDDDVAYLSDSLGISGSLITLKVYSGSMDILDYTPKTEVTSNNFSVTAMTSAKAICNFKFDGGSFSLMTPSVNYMSHVISKIYAQDGAHKLNFNCIDVLGNKVDRSYDLNVDSTKGIRVVSYTPKYSASPQVLVNLDLSEDILCKYSNREESPSSFGNISELTGTGLGFQRSFSASLVVGKNIYYIYCDKGGSLSSNEIEIYYDNLGPVISNLVFMNGKISSDYVADNKRISFKFDVNSTIPVDTYYVRVVLPNETISKEVSSSSASINGDFTGATRISIVPQNAAGKNGTVLEKPILFDLEDPKITFLNNNGNVNILCIDLGSGCNRINYGVSSTPIDCLAKTSYNINTSISVANNNYICAEGFDRVGHRGFSQQLILFGSGLIEAEIDVNETSGENISDDDNIVDTSEDVTPPIDDAWTPSDYNTDTTTDGGINYLIIGAVVLVLAGASGGGYYAYKKGYLNKELARLGIKLPNQNKSSNLDGNINSNAVKSVSGPIEPIAQNGLTRSKYDEHLHKLNSFVDDTIQKRKDMFDKFGDSAGKTSSGVKSAESLKSKKVQKKSMSQEDFDDFYSPDDASASGGNLKSLDTKNDAENFEDYYQKKKKGLNASESKEPKKSKK